MPLYDVLGPLAVSAFGNSEGPFSAFQPVGSIRFIPVNLISPGEPGAPSDFHS